jgi:hypothetical protein
VKNTHCRFHPAIIVERHEIAQLDKLRKVLVLMRSSTLIIKSGLLFYYLKANLKNKACTENGARGNKL